MSEVTGSIPLDEARPAGGRARAVSTIWLKPCARFSLRLPFAAAAQSSPLAGFHVETPINTCVTKDGRSAARLGPDEWLLIDAAAESAQIEEAIRDALHGSFFSLVDIGYRNLAIEIAGPRARDVINAGCPLDLHDRAFPPGSATRSLFGKAEIILMRPRGDHAYRMECWRSFAPYVGGLLIEAAREFEAD
jgi:sarcosine oxidase, subunit gamma